MTSSQLEWAAIAGAAALGLGLLIYDMQSRRVKTTEEADVKLKIEELWHYPIKGLGGIRIESGKIGPQGFEDDRTFCLEKIHRNPETQEIVAYEMMYSGFHLQMVLFKSTIEEGQDGKNIVVTRVGQENPEPEKLHWTGSKHQIRFQLRPRTEDLKKVRLDVIGSVTDAYDMGEEVANWFSSYIGFETHLVYIGTNSRVVLGSAAPNGTVAQAKRFPYTSLLRQMLPSSLAPQPDTITFQDFGQYLIITKESNDEVSSRLAEGLEMDISKFRANIIVSGSPAAYDEDYWAQVILPGDIKLEFGATCWRCQAITVDYKTGKTAEGDEGLVWKKLASDRRVDKGWKYGPVFGKYAYTARKYYGKEIRAGDEIRLTKRVKERPVFDWPLPKAAIAAFQ